MKKIFSAIAIFITLSASAQVTKVTLQASGLTCSMCSNSISKALKTLPFAQGVNADIKNSSFDIIIKPGSKVSPDEIKSKVEGAGFFVANMKATVQFNNQPINSNDYVSAGGLNFRFINVKNQTLSGPKTLQILDKGFLSAKAFKKNEIYTKTETNKKNVTGGTRIYLVTI